MTIPRLELTAARIATRLAVTVREALSKYDIKDCTMWSDSHTVLHWINGQGRYKQLLDHRVKEINNLLPLSKWKYCPAKENPADLGTRGKIPSELIESNL